jgi:hypothetical protein
MLKEMLNRNALACWGLVGGMLLLLSSDLPNGVKEVGGWVLVIAALAVWFLKPFGR